MSKQKKSDILKEFEKSAPETEPMTNTSVWIPKRQLKFISDKNQNLSKITRKAVEDIMIASGHPDAKKAK